MTSRGRRALFFAALTTITGVGCTPRPDPAAKATAAANASIDPADLEGVLFDPAPYPVASVIDGDTFRVARGTNSDSVRLLGINAPETGDGRREVECFGRQAKERARYMLKDKDVYLATDPALPRRDEYGRLLAYVWLADDGTFVNLSMIEDGYADEFTRDQPYRHRDRFRRASRDAREYNRGLWAPDTCAGRYDAPPVEP